MWVQQLKYYKFAQFTFGNLEQLQINEYKKGRKFGWMVGG